MASSITAEAFKLCCVAVRSSCGLGLRVFYSPAVMRHSTTPTKKAIMQLSSKRYIVVFFIYIVVCNFHSFTKCLLNVLCYASAVWSYQCLCDKHPKTVLKNENKTTEKTFIQICAHVSIHFFLLLLFFFIFF